MAPPHVSDRIRELTRPTGEEDLLAVRYPSPRIHVPVLHAVVVVVILAVGLAVWAGCSARSGAGGDPAAAGDGGGGQLPSLELSAHPGDATTASPAATSEPTSVVVSVVGDVEQAGLVTLAPGARVADALAIARPGSGADINSLNQAQLLADGQQIVVGPPAPEGEPAPPTGGSFVVGDQPGGSPDVAPSAGAGVSGVLININTAGAEELKTLSGVGDVTAAAIVSFREEHGPFTAVEQLLEVSGIGPAKMAQLEGKVTV